MHELAGTTDCVASVVPANVVHKSLCQAFLEFALLAQSARSWDALFEFEQFVRYYFPSARIR